MKTLYHGTDDSSFDPAQVNPDRGRFDICLTDDANVAAGYGEHVHAFTGKLYAHDAEDVVEIADEYGLNRAGHERIEADSPYFYLLIDEPAVQDALVAEGIYAVEYEDEDWDNEIHTCIRVLKPGLVAAA